MSDLSHKKSILKRSGFRSTPARLAVLTFFLDQSKPCGISTVCSQFPEVDQATIYRIVNDFHGAGILEQHDIGHGHQDFEIANRDHHHHIVCEDCGDIEDLFVCGEDQANKEALGFSKKFSKINRHMLTYHGVCHNCAT